MPETSGKSLVLLGPFYPYRGGIAHFLEIMYRGLQNRGHEVKAVTYTRQYPDLLFPGKTQYETQNVPDPVPAHRILDTIGPHTWFRTASNIARLKPDAVIYKYWMPFFAPAYGTIARYLRKKDIKSIAVVDNAIPHERRPGDITLSRYFLRACRGLITMSESVQEDIKRLGVKAPVYRIEHPIYNIFGDPVPKTVARAHFSIPDDAPVLLFFGFIRRYKGLHVLLESLARVIEQRPDVLLLVAGEFYDDEAFYRSLIQKYGLQDNLRLYGDYIPDEEIPYFFSAADLVVQPYVTATQSGVAQIAFHFDKPLIVTNVGGLAEIVPHEKAGLVVPPENPEMLARSILRFFDENMYDRLSEGVRQEKKKYSWDRLYESIEVML